MLSAESRASIEATLENNVGSLDPQQLQQLLNSLAILKVQYSQLSEGLSRAVHSRLAHFASSEQHDFASTAVT